MLSAPVHPRLGATVGFGAVAGLLLLCASGCPAEPVQAAVDVQRVAKVGARGAQPQPKRKQEPVERNERLALYIAGQRVGHMVAVDRIAADGRLELVRESHLRLKRGPAQVELSSRTVTYLDPELNPLRYEFFRDEAGGRIEATGVVHGRLVEITTRAGGATTTKTIELEPGVTFAAVLEVRSRRNLRDGEHFKGRVLLEELGAVVEASYTTRATAEGFTIAGQVAGIEQVEKLDKRGNTVRIEIPALGAYAVPEDVAPPPQAATLDVIAKTVWPAPPDMPAPGALAATMFRIDGKLQKPLPQDRRQRLVETRGEVQIARVERLPRGAPEKLGADERAAALAETPYEPIHDPRIVQAAQQVIRGAKDDADKVARLTLFVFEKVEEKDLTRAYAPATATLESGVGDCTEHSVLFSALAKASGLPVRLVDGVIVADGRIGYHEWVEVYLPGEGWRPVDPTFGEPRAGPNRLKLATGSSQPESLLQMGLSAASALTGLKITVVGHERR